MSERFSTKGGNLKKCISLLVMFILVTVMLFLNSQTAYSSGTGIDTGQKCGWSKKRQGMRFSIYDMKTYTTVSTIDFLYNGKTGNDKVYQEAYEEFKRVSNSSAWDIIKAKGCKYAYLDQYREKGYDKEKIKDLTLYGVDVSRSGDQLNYIKDEKLSGYHGVCSSFYMGNIALNDRECLMPIKTHDLPNGNFAWETNIPKITQIKKKIIEPGFKLGDLDQGILNRLGFYVVKNNGNANLRHFDSNYILVIEPTLFAFMFYRSNGIEHRFIFYGTPTEFAILDAKLLHADNFVSYDGNNVEIQGNIHNGYKTITLGASLNAVIPDQTDYNIPFDKDINIIKYSGINTPPSDYCKNIHNNIEADDAVLRGFAVTTISHKNFAINTELVTEQAYHTGSTGILSFKLETVGRAYEPDIGKLLAGDNPYGLKLELKTTNDSEVKSPLLPTEIYSDGMPEGEIKLVGDAELVMPVDTYVFTEFKVPDTPGVWRFEVQIFDAYGNPVTMTSDDNEINSETGGCIYEVRIEETIIDTPPNYFAGDKKPKSTEFRSLNELKSSLPNKKNEHKWWYYSARAGIDGEGNPGVIMTKVEKTADYYIADSYAPMSHKNIPVKYKNGRLVTRSGYGIGADVEFVDEVSDGEITGFQSGIMLFPEYGYGSYGEPLERTDDGFCLAENKYSMYYDDAKHSDYSRVHFTPIWYPDGEYEVIVFLFDCWTPAGELWDAKSYKVTISGTVYDDWYITRR